MFTEDKITEIFCMANDFCKFYDEMMAKYTIKEAKKRDYHRDGTLDFGDASPCSHVRLLI